jgi:hypothetical protein
MDASTLARRLAALPALAMRRAVLREALAVLRPEEAVPLLGELVRRGREGAPFDVSLVALGAVLDGGDLGYERHGAIYAAARDRGDASVARLLLSAQPPPPGRPVPAAPPPALGRAELTLGERKALARGNRGDLLQHLLRDPDPAVIRILLGNPRITEADVVTLAARRPSTAEAQQAIFRSERFICRYSVRRALVLNPYTPSDLAARLVGLMTEPDLRQIATDPSLPATVRLSARDQLDRRQRPG